MSDASIDRLSGDVAELQDEVAEAKETLVEHATRFENGRHVMDELKGRVTSVEKRIEPKAPDWQKLLLAGLTVIGVLMGAQLWITEKFNDRPTHEEVQKMTGPLKDVQRDTAREIGDIEKSQSAQAESIRNIETLQKDQGRKIDAILERLPARGSRR
jgi:hypothetical protein